MVSEKEKNKIKELIKLFPRNIEVKIVQCEEGGFFARIKNFDGCLTQAETLTELIENVNDAVLTCLDVPEKYVKYMPSYMPPTSLFQRFRFWPEQKTKAKEILKFKIAA